MDYEEMYDAKEALWNKIDKMYKSLKNGQLDPSVEVVRDMVSLYVLGGLPGDAALEQVARKGRILGLQELVDIAGLAKQCNESIGLY